MEVHAHTHTERKKFTHYLWEFLMLFLAVFCGFLAENQREHMVEHQRERQYIKTFIKDLQSDTLMITYMNGLQQNIFNGLDSLMFALKTVDAIEKPEVINQYFSYAKDYIQFVTAGRTMQQVKNSGNMRLIRKTNVSDSLTLYDQMQQFLTTKFEEMNFTRNEVLNLLDEIVDENTVVNSEVINRKLLTVASANTILTKDRHKLDVLFNKLKRLKGLQLDYSRFLMLIYGHATGLIVLMQKEYHLK